MKLSLHWLKQFVDIPDTLSAEELGERITQHTAEVEGAESQAQQFDKMIVGKVLKLSKHPNADKLTLCEVDTGSEPAQIVCGGVNLKEGMLVAVAPPGAWVRWHGEGDLIELKTAKIRGETSHGMICAGEEIGLEADKEGEIKDLSHLDVAAGTPLAEALGKDDIIFDIDNKSLTHRPDLWGHYGFARELAALLKTPLKPLDGLLADASKSMEKPITVDIKDPEICQRFSACVVTGIRIAPSPQWMQNALSAAGVNCHNNIVDITNYVMLELGQPMHAYDRKVVGSDHLTVDWGKKDLKLVTLDSNEHELSPEDPVIYNEAGEPLIVAGVKGGLKSGIHDDTTEIILEAANWHPTMIRRASFRHALRTDASQRFEKGLDPSLTELAIQRALQLILQLCPTAQLASPLTTVGDWTAPKTQLELNLSSVHSKIGIPIPSSEILDILQRLEFDVDDKGDTLLVTVPTHRATGDVELEEDLIEEIARLHGYDKIPAELPELPTHLPLENPERFHKYTARRILAHNLGFTEVMNYSFYSKDRLTRCNLSEDGHFKVLNYLSEDQTHMRMSMTPNILATLAKNAANYAVMRVFEIGRSYKDVGDYMPLEEKKLIAAIASNENDELFFEAKGAFEQFMKQFRAPYKLQASKTPPPYAHPKKCLDVLIRGKKAGVIFTVHPGVRAAMNLPHEVSIFAVKWAPLSQAGQTTQRFRPLPKFPGMTLDVSVLIDERSEVAQLEAAMRKADQHKLIQNIQLFDIYQGRGIPEGHKSLSFSVELRHEDRTLTDEEFQKLQEAIFLALEALGGKIRGKQT